MARMRVVPLLLSLAASGCILSGRPRPAYEARPEALKLPSVVVYQGSTGPLSYQAAVGKDGQRMLPTSRVRGRACQRGIQIPLFAPLYALGASPGGLYASAGWGEGAFREAVDDARKGLPAGAVLFDVRADLNTKMILSVYREQCLVVDAGVLVPVPVATTSLPVAATPEPPAQ